MKTYGFLALAIAFEIIATSFLKASEGFTRTGPSVATGIGYIAAFFFLSQALKAGLPLGMGYAIWSGLGTAFIALIGWLVFKQELDLPAIIGITMIIAGVCIMQIFSKSQAH